MMTMSVQRSAECLAGETRVLGENMPPELLCPPQISHDLTWARTRVAAVGIRQLTNRLMYSTAYAKAFKAYTYFLDEHSDENNPLTD
jgi:hypothetical protein